MKELDVTIREQQREDFEAIQQENEELKEVLSDVQVKLESKTEVCIRKEQSYNV